MKREDDIVFEDLHGNPDEVIDVDLDVDEEPGIKRRSQEASVDDDPDSGVEGRSAAKADEDDDADGDDDKSAAELAAARAEAKAAREELERYRNQHANAQREADKQAVARLDSEITSIEEQLEEAIEAGDTKKQVRLTSQLTDLKSRKLTAELRATSEPEKPKAEAKGSNPKVGAWMSKNRWYNQPGKERYTRITNRIDRDIANEGYDPASDDYWTELDLRLKREAPELFEGEEKPSRKGGDRVAPVGDGGGDRSRRRTADSRVRLERADFKVMRKFGLDPNDPAHVKEFARNKLEAEREERARSRA